MYKSLLVCLLLITLPSLSSAASWQWISPQRLHSLVKDGSGLWIVDIRGEAGFTQSHIESAIHIPGETIGIRNLPKQKMIVLVDDALGQRNARRAADTLAEKGYEKVYVLEGGLAGWREEGLSLAGEGRSPLRVMPEDVAWAQSKGVPVKVFDLRDENERKQWPFPQAEVAEGLNLDEKVKKIKEKLKPKKGIAQKLEKRQSVVLVIPTSVEAAHFMIRMERHLPEGDVRYVEGGHAAWAATPDKEIKIPAGCPTCPGGSPGGVIK